MRGLKKQKEYCQKLFPNGKIQALPGKKYNHFEIELLPKVKNRHSQLGVILAVHSDRAWCAVSMGEWFHRFDSDSYIEAMSKARSYCDRMAEALRWEPGAIAESVDGVVDGYVEYFPDLESLNSGGCAFDIYRFNAAPYLNAMSSEQLFNLLMDESVEESPLKFFKCDTTKQIAHFCQYQDPGLAEVLQRIDGSRLPYECFLVKGSMWQWLIEHRSDFLVSCVENRFGMELPEDHPCSIVRSKSIDYAVDQVRGIAALRDLFEKLESQEDKKSIDNNDIN